MHMSPIAFVVAALALMPPGPAAGQAGAAPFPRASLDSVRLDPGRTVQVSVDGVRVHGVVRGGDASSVVLRVRSVDRTIDRGAIDSLWVLGRNTKRGAVIGGASFGALGTYFALTDFWAGAGESTGDSGGALVRVRGAVAVTAVGAVLGGAVGTVLPNWRLRFP